MGKFFEREDWSLFRNLGTLSQKAGVPTAHLRRLVLKELVDNALDAGANVIFGKEGDHTYWVQDDGPGIPGTAEEIASLFSVRRPLTSTKIVRLPVRGALGNGLRVVVGAVLASGGELVVTTRGYRYHLQPLDDGSTKILSREPASANGTTVKVTLLHGIPADPLDMMYAKLAKNFAFAQRYEGNTSAWWYDGDSFYELLQSAGHMVIDELVSFFEGIDESILMERGLSHHCNQVSRDEADQLLLAMRGKHKATPPKKIGLVGNPSEKPYAKVDGTLTVKSGRSIIDAQLPYVVEAWATEHENQRDDDTLIAYVNGTPIVGEMRARRDKPTQLAVFGCGLRHHVDRVSPKKCLIQLNITIPYMPITTDGKEPDFERLYEPIAKVISKSTRQLKSEIKKRDNPNSQTDLIFQNLQAGIRQASGRGVYRFSQRQLYYCIRPFVLEAGYPELNWAHFCRQLTEYEAEHGEIRGMYRDPRGNLYHPHLRTTIPLGTLAVEEYTRPEWTFNKILYSEKEGFTNLLIADGWPERNDCALVSSKGFASRAVRDVLDLLGETDEELLFFCIHDADASGTLIYQSLQEATRARAARKVKIINLGLEPWDAVEMDLQVEQFERKNGRSSPVARYVTDRSDRDWEEWLQNRRSELNAMTSPQFLEWLNDKMLPHQGKVIPPADVLRAKLATETKAAIRRRETIRILEEADIDTIVGEHVAMVQRRLDEVDVRREVSRNLGDGEQWTQPVQVLARAIANGE